MEPISDESPRSQEVGRPGRYGGRVTDSQSLLRSVSGGCPLPEALCPSRSPPPVIRPCNVPVMEDGEGQHVVKAPWPCSLPSGILRADYAQWLAMFLQLPVSRLHISTMFDVLQSCSPAAGLFPSKYGALGNTKPASTQPSTAAIGERIAWVPAETPHVYQTHTTAPSHCSLGRSPQGGQSGSPFQGFSPPVGNLESLSSSGRAAAQGPGRHAIVVLP